MNTFRKLLTCVFSVDLGIFYSHRQADCHSCSLGYSSFKPHTQVVISNRLITLTTATHAITTFTIKKCQAIFVQDVTGNRSPTRDSSRNFNSNMCHFMVNL